MAIKKVTENPFYNQVDGSVTSELNARAEYYGSKVRGVGKDLPVNVIWAYTKTAYGLVSGGGFVLGTSGTNVMSDEQGKLTLYDAQRNQPKKPLLTGITVSNEGTIGSLLKGKFTFTAYPRFTKGGFDIDGLEKAFFTPGKEVTIQYGWSASASNKAACSHKFTGIISNFNWNFNADLSITADVSIVSKASVAIGVSGDVATSDSGSGTPPATDPLLGSMKGGGLSSDIKKDLGLNVDPGAVSSGGGAPIVQVAAGGLAQIPKTGGMKFGYTAISVPFSDEPPEKVKDPNAKNPTPSQWNKQYKLVYYIKLGDIIEYMNEVIRKTQMKELFEIAVGNDLELEKDINFVSAYPLDIMIPKKAVYGSWDPFGSAAPKTPNPSPTPTNSSPSTSLVAAANAYVTTGITQPIEDLLLSTDYVIKKFDEYLKENATNTPSKNVTTFFTNLIERINNATGDMVQLTATMVDDMSETKKAETALLVIANSNVSSTVSSTVKPYMFTATIFKPLIKSANISSHPPGPQAAAAFVQARPGDNPNSPNLEVQNSNQENGPAKNESENANEELVKSIGVTAGFSEAWAQSYRDNLAKFKKSSGYDKQAADYSWLHKALYPVDLSLTIDGISGFKFGNVIKTTLIPSYYNDPRVDLVFVITKIDHSIKDGVWETTLNTSSRISPNTKL